MNYKKIAIYGLVGLVVVVAGVFLGAEVFMWNADRKDAMAVAKEANNGYTE